MSSSDGGGHRPWQPPGSDGESPPPRSPPMPPPVVPGPPPRPGTPSPDPWTSAAPPPPPRHGVHPVALAGLSLLGTLLAAGLVYLLISGGGSDDDTGTAGPSPDTGAGTADQDPSDRGSPDATAGATTTSPTTTGPTASTVPGASGARLLLGVQIAVELSLGDLDLIGVEEADCTVERLAEDVDDDRLDEVYNRSSAIVAGDDAEAVLDVLDEEEGQQLVEAANSCFDFPAVMEGQAADVLGAVAQDMDDVELTDTEAGCAATGLLEEIDQYRVALFLYAPADFEFTTTETRVMTGVIADCVG